MTNLISKNNSLEFKVAELKLQYTSNRKISKMKVTSSKDAHSIFSRYWSEQINIIEEFNILLLNRNNLVLGIQNISKGGYSATIVDAKVVFTSALIGKASGIILAHNHPSGNLKPSQEDIRLTEKLAKGAKLLDINVLDHLILTDMGYFSFADEGLI